MDRPGAQLGSGHTEGTRDFPAVGGAAASASESCFFLQMLPVHLSVDTAVTAIRALGKGRQESYSVLISPLILSYIFPPAHTRLVSMAQGSVWCTRRG